jgi:23S rRNA (cytosine1962-C5)-methyltransferase
MTEPLAPPFPAFRILFRDEALIVADKPAGISTETGEPGDLVSRVRALVHPGGGGYVAAPVPLERDTSGAVALVLRKDLHRAVAASPPEIRCQAVIEGTSLRGARVLETKGSRALIEIEPGRRRPREALLDLGARIAGERAGMRGKRPVIAPLHVSALELRHPITGEQVSVAAETPARLLAMVRGPEELPAKRDAVLRLVLDAASARHAIAAAAGTTCYRLVHGAGDDLPGVDVDVYGEHLVLQLSSPRALELEEMLLDVAFSLGVRGVYLKRRPKQASTVIDTRRDELAPKEPSRGDPAPDPLVVTERGERFLVRLGDGLSTGIFVDQRDNRALVRSLSKDRSVLNLFAYACAFTVSAAHGGAKRSVSVDVSASALAWGEDNLRENGLHDPARHRFVKDDAMVHLARAAAKKERFDVVILDPPSFATTKTARFVADEDYPAMAAACFSVLSRDGALLACTNHRKITPRDLRRFVETAAARAGRELSRVKELPPPVDHPSPPGGEPHLKTVLAFVR